MVMLEEKTEVEQILVPSIPAWPASNKKNVQQHILQSPCKLYKASPLSCHLSIVLVLEKQNEVGR